MVKKRVDILLVERGLVESRTRAQSLIMAGQVYAGLHSEIKVNKAGHLYPEDIHLRIKDNLPWVGRGALKLIKALETFPLNPSGVIAMDVGSSTGGFTEVLLHYNAQKVYAIDVGTNQLAWKLRNDPRVVVMEQTNARYLTHDLIPESPEVIVCDVSFISLSKALPAAMALASPGARLVALIKPQFEVEKGQVGKGGIIRDPHLHQETTSKIFKWLNAQAEWTAVDIIESPIYGTNGNKEYLIFGIKSEQSAPV